MKKITSLILAMAMVFSLSAQVFALNDDMQDNENSEANMIVITTSKEERDKQFNDAMAKVMEQLEGPTLTRDNKERFKYEHFDYQYKTLKGYAGNQLSGVINFLLVAVFTFLILEDRTFLAAYRFHFRLRTILYQLVSALEIEARRRAYM